MDPSATPNENFLLSRLFHGYAIGTNRPINGEKSIMGNRGETCLFERIFQAGRYGRERKRALKCASELICDLVLTRKSGHSRFPRFLWQGHGQLFPCCYWWQRSQIQSVYYNRKKFQSIQGFLSDFKGLVVGP